MICCFWSPKKSLRSPEKKAAVFVLRRPLLLSVHFTTSQNASIRTPLTAPANLQYSGKQQADIDIMVAQLRSPLPRAEERINIMVKKATDEYARLAQKIHQDRKQGRNDPKTRNHHIGEMSAIVDMVALATGEDSITISFQMDKQAYERLGEVFPMNSFFSHGSLIFAHKTR